MDIRKAFLDYFSNKGHTIIESSALVPDDATLLFTNAGMVQFKDIFTGSKPIPTNPRATSSQTCIRAGGKHNDLENVGFTARHHTFFEMLGNFSFGDYFKEDAIRYAWEFVTDVLELPKEKLWITIHDSDDEAGEIWKKYVSTDKIVKMGDKDNFWQMGDTGPCGPCSEIHFDQGSDKFSSDEDYLGGEGDRFLEIWNLVFMQYERSADGKLTPLPKPSIDTGMGLERITAIKEGVTSNYDCSLFMPLINEISKILNVQYKYSTCAGVRVIADHIRACSFLLAQGVNFDKEGRGYVLRRIMRRAIRHGYLLGRNEPFMYLLVDKLCELMGSSYPYLIDKSASIKERMKGEEERFFSTISSGMELFEKELKLTKNQFSGEAAFKLYDTFGFPLDLTEDMLREKGYELDLAGFEAKMDEQRKMSKAAWKGSGDEKNDGDFKALLEKYGKNKFIGYDVLATGAKVLALLDENFKECSKLTNGQTGWVLLDETPFYAMSGGQAGDEGSLEGIGAIVDTRKFFDLNMSKVIVANSIEAGDSVYACVDENRVEIAKHHSATHLLHAVLREVLGESVQQAGSDVNSARLRFDFTYQKAVTKEQLKEIEQKVNLIIARSVEGDTAEMKIEEAKSKGAMALFGEKYGSTVRVVSFGDYSIELCGGTHITNTSQIGSFYIVKEGGVSAGVRRIEAVVSLRAVEFMNTFRSNIEELEVDLKNKDLRVGISKLKNEIKDLKDKLAKASTGAKADLKNEVVNNTTVIIDDFDGDAKTMVDEIKNRYEKVVVMLFSQTDDKISVTSGTKGVNVNAGEWLKDICAIMEGKGGGRADFASGSGKNMEKINEAKVASLEFIKSKL